MNTKTLSTALLLLTAPLLAENPSNLDTLKQAESFYTSCIQQTQILGLTEETAHLYHQLALVHLELGHFSDALVTTDKALDLYGTLDSFLTKTRLRIVDAHILRGRLLGFSNQYREAVVELIQTFEENWQLRGEKDLETTRFYQHLSWHLGRLGKQGVTLDDLGEVKSELTMLSYHLAEWDPTLLLRDNSPSLLILAEQCAQRALAADIVQLGDSHPDTAKSYSLVGWILGDQKNHEAALTYHARALAIRQTIYAEAHADTARSYDHLGWNYEQLHHFDLAKEYYAKALAIETQLLPEGHPELEKTRANLQRVSAHH